MPKLTQERRDYLISLTRALLFLVRTSVSLLQRSIKKYYLPIVLFVFILGFFWTDVFSWNNEYHELKRFLRRYIIFPALIGFTGADYLRIYKLIPVRFFLIFLGYLCLSLVWSNPTPGEIFYDYVFYSFYILCFVAIVIITTQYNYKFSKLIGPVFISIISLHVLIASWFWYTEHSLQDRLQSSGILNQSIELATVYSATAAYSGISYFCGKDKLTVIYLPPFFICLGGVILTISRGPLLALLLVIILGTLLIRERRAKVLLVFIIFMGLAFIIIEPSLFYALLERGVSYRPEIWSEGWRKITESWIFGYGVATPPSLLIENQVEIVHYHNIFLATWFYSGIIGLLLLIIMIVTTLAQGLRAPDAWPWLAAFVTSLLCLFTNGNKLIYYLRPEWFYFWLPFAMILASINIQSLSQNPIKSHLQELEKNAIPP